MRKYFVNHENLRRNLEEFKEKGDDVSDETLDMILAELQHSCLIIAGDVSITHQMAVFNHGDDRCGFLFTDMDEFRKFDSKGECPSQACDFEVYKSMVSSGDIDCFVLNPMSEGFIIVREIFEMIKHLPQHDYPSKGAYTPFELRDLRDSMDNTDLEEFIKDPSNTARYEELFCEISNSTLLTLMVSREDLTEFAEDGIINMEDNPRGFLYLDEMGGKYATVYTSEERISGVATELNKYSQIVNFSQLTNYALNAGLDGIIINPNMENVMISREVLLEYWYVLEEFCNDQKLNAAIKHMFLIKEEA